MCKLMKRGATKFVSLNKFSPGQQLLRFRVASGSTSRLETLGCAIHSIQLGGCGGGMVLEWCANCDNGDWEGNRF